MFEIKISEPADDQWSVLKQNKSLEKRYKTVSKAIGFLAVNPRHPSLQTHEYSDLKGPNGEKVFEAYAENQTPGAYRVFWYYGPNLKQITILAITPHP